MIVNSIEKLKDILNEKGITHRPIYMTSGGFDPIHIGHLRCIQHTAAMASNADIHPYNMTGLVIVVVNGDRFLKRKKGYSFMPLAERMEIIDGFKGVDYVVPYDADFPDQTVIGAISALRPSYFTKGGDRFDASTIPEWEICQQIGCQILTGIGGGKIQSSSDLVKNSKKNMGTETWR
tara:strand:- start:3946 stop:4479 length:534 start_codon:yes stop_codon:yes gene_type:complete